MKVSRRSFVKAALGGAALFLPEAVAAEPARRVWALDRTMLRLSDDDFGRRFHESVMRQAGRAEPLMDLGARGLSWHRLRYDFSGEEPVLTGAESFAPIHECDVFRFWGKTYVTRNAHEANGVWVADLASISWE